MTDESESVTRSSISTGTGAGAQLRESIVAEERHDRSIS